MENKQFYHVCADGALTRNFIISLADYFAAFNLVGVCAANTNVVVVSFSIEDSHPHFLLWGTLEDCMAFKEMYERQYRHYAAASRKGKDEIALNCEIYPIGNDENYLKNVAAYTVIQPTKDGKPVMFYDYRWGTGSMYFRNEYCVPVWCFDEKGEIQQPVKFGTLGATARRELLHSRTLTIPDDWLVCNGFILPSNYVDVRLFESIYKTHNRYRVFTSSTRQREEEMLQKMADHRGVAIEDLDARKLCGDLCKEMFGTRDPRRLDTTKRITLAQQLRRTYRMSFRQLAILVRINEKELRVYVKS
ncbi:MAG: hypothetical protein J6X39_02985 [Bacteroidales bacterium]|nr:hypothetical protein [Bacteroidales bacterium]